MIRYDKLVRDKIPEIIASSGKVPITRYISGSELDAALRNKLKEESAEALSASSRADLLAELADVVEVLDALLRHHDLDMHDLEQIRTAKRAERGGFEKAIVLDRVEDRDS